MTSVAHFEGLAGRVKRKEAGTTPLDRQVIAIYGIQGSGKTSLAAGFPNSLYLDLESSLGDSHDANVLDINTWADFQKFVQWIANGGDLGDTRVLVIDTVAELWARCATHHFNLKNPPLQEWPDDFNRFKDSVRADFKTTMDLLRAQAKLDRLGLVLIAHEKENTRKDMLRGELTSIVPDAGDHSKNTGGIDHYIGAKPHMVLRTHVAFVHPTNPAIQWPEGKYLTQANPVSEGTVVKDRSRRLPTFFGTDYAVLEREYNLGPEGRAKAKAAAAKAAAKDNPNTKDN